MKQTTLFKDDKVYCPRWSAVFGEKTQCLKENCTNFIPSQEINGEFFEGFCLKHGIFDCLSAIMVSLGVISGQMALQPSEDVENDQKIEEEGPQYG